MSEQRISTRARVLAIPAIGASAIGVAIFSRSSAQMTPTPSASPSPAASPSPMASPEPGMENAAGGTASAALSFTAGDLFFDPKEATIVANTDVQVTVQNNGALAHDWVVQDQNQGTELLNPGDGVTINVNLPAGNYTFICTVPGHAEAGMTGTLTVQ